MMVSHKDLPTRSHSICDYLSQIPCRTPSYFIGRILPQADFKGRLAKERLYIHTALFNVMHNHYRLLFFVLTVSFF